MGYFTENIFEFIYGPVANDDVYEALNLYADGTFDREDTIKRLKVKELYNQLAFTTDKALSYLQLLQVI